MDKAAILCEEWFSEWHCYHFEVKNYVEAFEWRTTGAEKREKRNGGARRS